MVDGIVFETNPARLRHARKMVASGIGPRELDKFRPRLRAHVIQFLGKLLHKPDKFLDHIREYVCRLLNIH